MTTLTPGTLAEARLTTRLGERWKLVKIVEQIGKGYRVQTMDMHETEMIVPPSRMRTRSVKNGGWIEPEERAFKAAQENMVARVNAGAGARPVPKPRRKIRMAGYMAWIRTLPCCGCGVPGPNDAHHYGERGLGQKADDLRTLSLCRACHSTWHDHRCLPGRGRAEAERHMLRMQTDCLVEWIARQAIDGEML